MTLSYSVVLSFCSGYIVGTLVYMSGKFFLNRTGNLAVGDTLEYKEKDPFKYDYSQVKILFIKDGYVLYEGKHNFVNSMNIQSFRSLYKKVKN